MNRYVECPPRPELAATLACVWLHEAGAGAPDQAVAPDGCPELIIHLRRPYAERLRDGARRRRRALFAGQTTRPLHLVAQGPTHVVAARFRPEGAGRFLPAPAHRYTDLRTPLAGIHGEAAAASLVRGLAAAPDDGTRLALIQDFIADRLGPPPPDQVAVARCVERLQESEGRLALDDLAAIAGLSPRRLERRFRDIVGIPPRTLRAIIRYRRVFDALAEAPGTTFTEAAAAAGYFDHAQMARDFRRFTGCTPSQFLKTGSGLAHALTPLAGPGRNLTSQAA